MVVRTAVSYMLAMTLIKRCPGGEQTDSQLFTFAGGAGPLALEPTTAPGTCLAVQGNALDQTACGGEGDATLSFTFG